MGKDKPEYFTTGTQKQEDQTGRLVGRYRRKPIRAVDNGEEYQGAAAVKMGIERLESRIAKDPPSRKQYEEWALWRWFGFISTCVKLELSFWDMPMNISY